MKLNRKRGSRAAEQRERYQKDYKTTRTAYFRAEDENKPEGELPEYRRARQFAAAVRVAIYQRRFRRISTTWAKQLDRVGYSVPSVCGDPTRDEIQFGERFVRLWFPDFRLTQAEIEEREKNRPLTDEEKARQKKRREKDKKRDRRKVA